MSQHATSLTTLKLRNRKLFGNGLASRRTPAGQGRRPTGGRRLRRGSINPAQRS